MKPAHEELQRRLAALRSRFADTGLRATAAANAMAATVPPDPALIDELRTSSAAFAELRDSVIEQVAPLAAAASLPSLAAIDGLLRKAVEAEGRRAKQAVWEHARETALGVLDRVRELIHREDAAFTPLATCLAKARELHLAIKAQEPDDLEQETTIVNGRVRPFTELMLLVDGWNVLDDDRCAFLQDTITQNFGRQLALAALRGKLGREGEVSAPAPAPPPPPPPRVHRAPSVPAAPAYSAPPAPAAPPPAAVPEPEAMPEPARAAEPIAPPAPPIVPATGPVIVTPTGVVVPVDIGPVPAIGGTLVVDRSAEAGPTETPEARRQRAEQLERLAAQSAPWWVAARTGWKALRARGGSFGDAAKETLKRHPHLLSVPIQKSAAHEGGRLAEGYALLLDYVEKQEEGFVTEALTRLNPQFTSHAKGEVYPLGQELYLYVVAEGRLYKTYPDFLKDVMARVVPEPGFWVQGGIIDAAAQTTVFTRPDSPGAAHAESTTLTDGKARFATHLFAATLGPLTARFFTLEAGELPEATDVEVKLKENDAASDRAWLVALPFEGTPEAPKKLKAGGTSLPGLGKQYRAIWIGVFNADPHRDKRDELAITLKRRAAPPPPFPSSSAAATSTFESSKGSPFAPKKKG